MSKLSQISRRISQCVQILGTTRDVPRRMAVCTAWILDYLVPWVLRLSWNVPRRVSVYQHGSWILEYSGLSQDITCESDCLYSIDHGSWNTQGYPRISLVSVTVYTAWILEYSGLSQDITSENDYI